MPEITRSGFSGSKRCNATITASAGGPSTAQCRGLFGCTTIGRRSVSDCAVPLCSAKGATTLTVAKSSNACCSARNPSAPYPSSFVRRMCAIGPGVVLVVCKHGLAHPLFPVGEKHGSWQPRIEFLAPVPRQMDHGQGFVVEINFG